jgi:hypothetical protein
MIIGKAHGDGNRRNPLVVTSQALEDRQWEWVQMVEAQNVCLSRELIRLKALDLQKSCAMRGTSRFRTVGSPHSNGDMTFTLASDLGKLLLLILKRCASASKHCRS